LPKAYKVPRPERPIDLKVDANEGAPPPPVLLEHLATLTPERLAHYPNASQLEAMLASRFQLDPRQVIVTAGADEAIDRVCRASFPRSSPPAAIGWRKSWPRR
ncbi:MAG: hypothetical protein AAF492_15005, partial [Verrucomicrobiota bacterium]